MFEQSNTESSEEIPERKSKGKLSRLLEAGAFALALLTAEQDPAQALEIAPRTSWSDGVTHNIKESVEKEKNESRFTYLKFSGNQGEWLEIKEGRGAKVSFVADDFARELLSHPRYRELEKICFGHSHTNENHRYVTPNKDAYKRMAASPSFSLENLQGGDIHSSKYLGDRLEKFRISKRKLTSFVADARGIWYYQPTEKFDKGDTFVAREKLQKAYDVFVDKSMVTDDVTSIHEYQNLINNYRDLGAIVRFVPYGEVSSEPSCAGVDYKKGKDIKTKEVAIKLAPITETKPIKESKIADGKASVSFDSESKTIKMRPPQ
ncbi:MAG: hypothetical protein Q7S12_02710 [bacterium]|nr:hypothetical protein [bacterium]